MSFKMRVFWTKLLTVKKNVSCYGNQLILLAYIVSNVTRRNPPSPLNKGKKTLLVEAKHRKNINDLYVLLYLGM